MILIYTLLRLRLLQLHRLLSATGYFFVLISMVAIGGIFFKALAGLMLLPSAAVIPLSLLILGPLHLARKDLHFLGEITESIYHKRQFICLEYGIILLPIICYQFVRHQYGVAVGLTLIPVLLSFMDHAERSFKWKDRPLNLKFIPVAAFELKIAMERYIVPVAVVWIISLLGFFHPAFLLVAVLIFLFLIIEGFTFNEPLEMLSSSKHFLIEKCGLSIGVITLLFGFQFLICAFLHPTARLVLLAGYAYMMVIVILAVTSKYAHYHPLKSRTMNVTALIVAMILGLLPGLILGSLLLSSYYYFRANKNIAYYAG